VQGYQTSELLQFSYSGFHLLFTHILYNFPVLGNYVIPDPDLQLLRHVPPFFGSLQPHSLLLLQAAAAAAAVAESNGGGEGGGQRRKNLCIYSFSY
jgi:hypothetical protein